MATPSPFLLKLSTFGRWYVRHLSLSDPVAGSSIRYIGSPAGLRLRMAGRTPGSEAVGVFAGSRYRTDLGGCSNGFDGTSCKGAPCACAGGAVCWPVRITEKVTAHRNRW